MKYIFPPAEDYGYLSQSGITYIENVSDEKDFEDMRAAMDVLGISKPEQMNVFQIIAGARPFCQFVDPTLPLFVAVWLLEVIAYPCGRPSACR